MNRAAKPTIRGPAPTARVAHAVRIFLATWLLLIFLLPSGVASGSQGSTALGDWGHFLSMRPRLHVDNPDGRTFSLTFYTMLWPVPDWNPPRVAVRVEDPEGRTIFWDFVAVEENRVVLKLPAGPAGTYRIDWGRKPDDSGWEAPNFWMEADLPRAVVWTGDPVAGAPGDRSAVEQRRPFFLAPAPRRWWFWVPEDAGQFVVRAQRAERHMSQREAWGLTVFSPRGQRVAILWGQPRRTPRDAYRQEMEQTIEVVPGTGGRFWSVEVRNADGHNYAGVNLTLDGVPPYLARSPEDWFNPDTGERAPVKLYDETSFVQAAFEEKDPERWPHLEHWVPSPSLGDPDGTQIRGPATFILWNPDGRPLRLALGDYLPRDGIGNDSGAEADVRIEDLGTGPSTRKSMRVPHYHGEAPPPENIPALSGEGVRAVHVGGVERWWAFTYPATPIVLRSDAATGRFSLEVGGARHWYFLVPRGTRSFVVRASVEHETDVVQIEINSPDRTVAMIYGSGGEIRVAVPEGLDGKLWHLRTDIGSGARLITKDRSRPRYLGVCLSLELEGVPPLLSPTWEQWFDPDAPVAPLDRTGISNR